MTLTKPFFLGVTEVTQLHFVRVLRKNPSRFKTAKHPVEEVTREEAIEFCARLSGFPAEKRRGRAYRLPTEAEWEYACRAGTTTAYSFGNDQGQLSNYGWHKANAGDAHRPTGLKKPNPWGLHDMHGNVFEWVHDTYRTYTGDAVTDPRVHWYGGNSVSRGGSWDNKSTYSRSSRRHSMPFDHRHRSIGFRVVCTIEK